MRAEFHPDGIQAEFHENGRIKRFVDFERGLANGLELIWDADGRLLSRQVYQQGAPVTGKQVNKPIKTSAKG